MYEPVGLAHPSRSNTSRAATTLGRSAGPRAVTCERKSGSRAAKHAGTRTARTEPDHRRRPRRRLDGEAARHGSEQSCSIEASSSWPLTSSHPPAGRGTVGLREDAITGAIRRARISRRGPGPRTRLQQSSGPPGIPGRNTTTGSRRPGPEAASVRTRTRPSGRYRSRRHVTDADHPARAALRTRAQRRRRPGREAARLHQRVHPGGAGDHERGAETAVAVSGGDGPHGRRTRSTR